MKLKRFFLPMMVMLLLLSGCKKEYVSVTYGSQVETYRVNVTPSQWKEATGYQPGSNNYWFCTLSIPAIDDEVFKNGTVQAYVWNVYDVSQNLGAWNLLPFVYPLEVYLPNDQGGQDLVMVPENMRFEWEKGAVTLIVHDLDGYRPVEIAETLSFRISVIKNM